MKCLWFDGFADPNHFFLGFDEIVRMWSVPDNIITNCVYSCMASYFWRILNASPVNFVVDHFLAHIIKSIVRQLKLSLLAGYVVQLRLTFTCKKKKTMKQMKNMALVEIVWYFCADEHRIETHVGMVFYRFFNTTKLLHLYFLN